MKDGVGTNQFYCKSNLSMRSVAIVAMVTKNDRN